MTPADPHWTFYLQAFSTPLIAVTAACIAWGQWSTARNKLKLDLFDRRFTIYEAARNFLGSVATSGKVKDDELIRFVLGTREARWLLNSDIADHLNRLHVSATRHQITYDEHTRTSPGDERKRLTKAMSEQRKELLAAMEVLDTKFDNFLLLDH